MAVLLELIDSFTALNGQKHSVTSNKLNLPKLASDHNPLLLTCGNWGWKKSYFEFETSWREVEDCKDKMKEWWESFTVNGRPGFVHAEKLKMLKAKLKEWSKIIGKIGN